MSAEPKKSLFPNDVLAEMRAHVDGFDRRNPVKLDRWRFDAINPNFDSAEGMFVARQLEFVRAGLYMIQYPDLKAQSLMPFDMAINTGAESHVVRSVDRAGQVLVTKSLAGQMPMLKMNVTEAQTSFFSLVLGYEYTIQDGRNAIYAGLPLPTMLAEATREEMERKLDDIAFVGDVTSGTLGLLTQSGGVTYTVPTTGAGASASWDNKTATQILLDLNGAPDQVYTASKEKEICDTMVLPTTRKRVISTMKVGDGTAATVLQYFLLNQEFIKTVESTYKSESNTNWTGKRGCAYKNDKKKLAVTVPQPFEQFQPVTEHASVTTMCHMRTGGLELYDAQSLVYFDGI